MAAIKDERVARKHLGLPSATSARMLQRERKATPSPAIAAALMPSLASI
jgi:hypothetical protein